LSKLNDLSIVYRKEDSWGKRIYALLSASSIHDFFR